MQNGLDTKVEKSRKQLKERKNRAKKIRGVKKVIKIFSFCALVMLSTMWNCWLEVMHCFGLVIGRAWKSLFQA